MLRIGWLENPDNIVYADLEEFADNFGNEVGISNRAQGEETLGAEIVYPGYAVRQTHRDGRERLGIYWRNLPGLLHLLIGVL